MRATMMMAALLAAAATPAAAAPKDSKAWAAAERVRPEQLQALEQVVNVDSGTGDVAGGRKVASLLVPQLKALGMDVEAVPAEAPDLPENIVATLNGTGRGRVLMIGHIDTVFGPGTVAMRPFRIDGDRAMGPGFPTKRAA